MNRSESNSMSKNVTTVGAAILVQAIIRYGAFVAMLWLTLSFVDVWVMALLK